MALILSIDTSSKNCSVSLGKAGVLIDTIEASEDSFLHAKKLHIFCRDLLLASNIDFSKIDAYAISIGPGSYTGLRIGSSAVKGFAFSFKKPVITIPTLESMAYAQQLTSDLLLCPVIDSRKGEVYAAIFDQQLNCLKPSHPHVLSEHSFSSFLQNQKVLFFGTGLAKIKSYVNHKNAVFLEDFFPSSKHLVELAESYYKQSRFADLVSFEPLYLKGFVPTKPKKNLL